MKGYWMKISALGDVSSQNGIKRLEEILPNSRIAYAARYHRKEDRLRSLAAGVLLTYSLYEMGESVPKIKNELESINWGGGQKPFLQKSNIHFNLSHSGQCVACVVGQAECGVDIQKKKEDVMFLKNFFTDDEWNWVLKESDKRAIRLWTLKESYAKYVGTGIVGELPKFDKYLSEKLPGDFKYSEVSKKESSNKKIICNFCEYEVHPAYALAVCSKEEAPKSFVEVEECMIENIWMSQGRLK